MTSTLIMTDKLNKIAQTLVGRHAKFEALTMASVLQLQPGDTVLTSSDLISENVFTVDVQTFIAREKKDEQLICLFKKKGILSFRKDQLVAYRPIAILIENGQIAREGIIYRQTFTPAPKPLNDFQTIAELAKEKVMVKMTFNS